LTGKLSGDNFFKILNSRWHCALIGNSAALWLLFTWIHMR
jgi:hypothetical protein